MSNIIEHKFTIRRVTKATDSDYVKALQIYTETTPFEIMTSSNEITYWLTSKDNISQFEIYIFILYLDEKVIGMSMVTYIKRSRIIVDEYLAVYNQYHINTIFLSFLSLIQNYFKENNIEVSFYLTEISNKNNGESIDKESQISLKILCLENFSKIEALYYTLPLGLENHESNFQAYLYAKSNDILKSITKETYLQIVSSMYYDYYYQWYSKFLSPNELLIYKKMIDQNYELIKKDVEFKKTNEIKASSNNCKMFGQLNITEKTDGIIPIDKITYLKFPFILISSLILPFLVIVGYSKALDFFNIQLSSVSTLIGGIISSSITSITALIMNYKKK